MRQVYAPTLDGAGYEAGSSPDMRSMVIMGVTLAAFAGVTHQAFQAAPAPVIEAPDGPIKVPGLAEDEGSAFASSLIYQPLRGEALSEDVHFRPEPERLVSAIPLQQAQAEGEAYTGDVMAFAGASALTGPAHRVQFGAVLSESAAKALWLAVLERSPDVLADAQLEIGRVVDKQGRNLYAVQTAPLADKAAANALCARLQSVGESCMATLR